MKNQNQVRDDIEFTVGKDHIVIQRRYEALEAFNDFLVAVWFLVGSFFFLTSSLTEGGTWLFIVGSTQLLIKPMLKMVKLVHVNRVYRRGISPVAKLSE